MIRNHLRLLRIAVLAVDGLAAVGLFIAVSIVRLGGEWQGAWLLAGAPWWAWAAAYGVLWVAAEWLHELDQVRARWTFRGEVLDILRALLLVAVAVFSLLFLVRAPDVSRLFLVALFGSQLVLSVAQRRLVRNGVSGLRALDVGRRNVVVLGTSQRARNIADRLGGYPALGYRILGHLGRPSRACPVPLGSLDCVENVLHDSVVDEILAVFEPGELAYLEPVIALAQQEGKRLRLVLAPGIGPVTGGRVERLGSLEILSISNGPDRLLGLAAKRLVDVIASGVALLLLAPLFAFVALVVWREDRGPIFFHQTRIGLHGRPFRMVKFRTMVVDAEARLADLAATNEIDGPAFKMSADPRITRIGRLLRRTSLDEVPQLWNVLLGQMSLVGPRPPLVAEVAGYDLWHRRRLSMKPGITGLWQVSARLESDFDRWVALDLSYIDRWSLWLDFKIMLRTVPAMLSGR